MLKRIGMLVIALALPALAFAEGVAAEPMAEIKEIRTEIGQNYVAYPQLSGMENEEIQKKINDDLVLSANIASHLITLSTLQNSTWGLRVEAESFLSGDVFSAVISAKGKMPSGREGHAYSAFTYDLNTGERLTLADLFADEKAAVAQMEAIAHASLGEELSGYMEHAELSPLPVDSFAVNGDGVTFYYPSEQFLLLSGYSGACQFYYEELAEWLRTDGEGLPARIGALPQTYTAPEAKERIAEAAAEGTLPHVPVKMGDSMADAVAKYRLARTPDEFPGGRYFALEAPAFRDVLLISDALENGYERSVAEGIQIKRGSLYGLAIGRSRQEDWRAILGEPGETMTFSETMAYDYNLPVGVSDVYHFGAHELRLHADEKGVLRSIQLGK